MYKFKEDQMRVPCYVWSEPGTIEKSAITQMKNASSLPFAFHHTALMPDGHQGYGVSIGSVIATKGVICPSMIGVDIGCGMCATRTNLEEISTEDLKKVMGLIREVVPVGFNHHKEAQSYELMPDETPGEVIIANEYDSAKKQIGTLGGGNHFIEIQKGNDGYIWVMIHSGSRNLGKKVADHYNKVAVKLNEKWFSSVEKAKDLAFLPVDSPEAHKYMDAMKYCVEFAHASRKLMIERVMDCFDKVLDKSVRYDRVRNVAHNYARWERHYGSDVIVHRKGATSARLGEEGIIPGSQGTASYIVEGLGNAESFDSCSHGAGRKMGRNEAMKKLDLESEIINMDRQGIIHGIRSVKDLDEAAGAYKDIEVVMENQKDLVKIITELKPLAVIKG